MSDVTYTGRSVRPLPAALLEPSAWIVPDPQRLVNRLFTSITPGLALAAWAGEICQQRDLLADVTRTVSLAELDAAANRAARHFHTLPTVYGPARSRAEAIAERRSRRQALLRPFLDAGLTLRQTARYCDLTVADVVGTVFGEPAARTAERICTAEEALRDGALNHLSQTAFAAQYGLHAPAVRRLVTYLGLELVARKGGRPTKVAS